MYQFIKPPNLPLKKISLAAISSEFNEIAANLTEFGINLILISQNKSLDRREASHADMNILHLDNNKIIIDKNNEYNLNLFAEYGFDIIKSSNLISEKYPFNIPLNACIIDNNIICNYSYTDKSLKDYIKNKSYNIIDIKQGYSKCSICIVNKNSIITSDSSIAHLLKTIGFNVLKIVPGYIELPGYDYGFIGGCSGLINKNKLVFTGNVLTHPNGKDIIDFCNLHGVEVISLTKHNLIDVGSIIPLAY